MKCIDAMLANRAIKDAFVTALVNTRSQGYHKTYSILVFAQKCWLKEIEEPPTQHKQDTARYPIPNAHKPLRVRFMEKWKALEIVTGDNYQDRNRVR